MSTSATILPEPERAYMDLHDQVRGARRGRSADPGRRADQQGYGNASADALAVPRRHRGERSQGDAVHQRRSTARASTTTSRCCVGAMGASPEIYRIGIGVPVDEVGRPGQQAYRRPDRAAHRRGRAVPRVVIEGDALDSPATALDALPVPISTPGWDNAPYSDTRRFITKDPDTGVQNIGIYRAQVKSPTPRGHEPVGRIARPASTRIGKSTRARGEKMPAAVVVGVPPAVAYRLGAEGARNAR